MADFIGVKSYKAKGKRLSSKDIKKVKMIDPLPYEVPEETEEKPDEENNAEEEVVSNEEVVEVEFEIDPELINPEAKLKDDLGLDSLDFVDVVVEIEGIFGIKLTGGDFISIVTLDDFHNLIIKKLK